MNRIAYAVMAAGLLLGGPGTLPARAQPGGLGGGPGAGPRAAMAAKMEARMKRNLGLSDVQESKLKDAFKAHREAVKPLGRKVRDLMTKLHDQLQDQAKDKDIAATLDSLKTAKKALDDERAKFTDSLASFLTPTQRAKMLMGMERRMGRERPGMRGRGRRGGRGMGGGMGGGPGMGQGGGQ